MQNDYSYGGLLKFLDYVADKGLLNRYTASGRKTACIKVLKSLDDREKIDLSKLDVEDIFRRFVNKNPSEHTPRSLGEYRRRLENSISDFLEYTKDPMKWKPSLSQSRKSPRRNEKTDGDMDIGDRDIKSAQVTSEAFKYPFPIREDVTIFIFNIPRDFKLSEAKRLSAFLETLATDFKPSH